MLTEVANALWRLQRAGQKEGSGLQQRFERAVALVDHIEPVRTLQAEALSLATHFDHPVYDCLYLVLARREVAALLSADQRLLKLAARVFPWPPEQFCSEALPHLSG
jgi:predicted nucleic acid-binding protein